MRIRLGLEAAPAATRLHAVAEEAVPTRDIAQAIGRTLGLPWSPSGPTLIEDILSGAYARARPQVSP
jgi:hypothetical protein